MSRTYTVEAVRNFTAMNSEMKVQCGEQMSLLLDNSKYCLVHRGEDVPFVVPKAYIVLSLESLDPRTGGSFSKFLKMRDMCRQKSRYPLCSLSLECVRVQFAAVVEASVATTDSEISLEKDTSVIILDPDPRSMLWFGVTQQGKFGMIPSSCLSVVTTEQTSLLQRGARLQSSARITYEARDPGELCVKRGTQLEIIGMPQMWKWQVRVPNGRRRIGLLPIFVLRELTTTNDPCKAKDVVVIPDPETEEILDTAGRFCTTRRSRPLPEQPTNNLNQMASPSEPNYYNRGRELDYNNKFSLEPTTDAPPMQSAAATKAKDLRGCLSDKRDQYDKRVSIPRLQGAIDQTQKAMSEMYQSLEQVHSAQEQIFRAANVSDRHAQKWKEARRRIQDILTETLSMEETDVDEGQYEYEEVPEVYSEGYTNIAEKEREDRHYALEEEDDAYYGTFPRRGRSRDASLRHSCSQSDVARRTAQVSRSETYATTAMREVTAATDGRDGSKQQDYTFFSLLPMSLTTEHVKFIVDCVCPSESKRPLVHWKPILFELGFDLERAREIMHTYTDPREQCTEALLAWMEQGGPQVTLPHLMNKLRSVNSGQIYHTLVERYGSKILPRCQPLEEEYV